MYLPYYRFIQQNYGVKAKPENHKMLCFSDRLETNSSNLLEVAQQIFHIFLWGDKTHSNKGLGVVNSGLGIRNGLR
ncbi:MAG: hypothetical protein A2Z01_08220 [Betaproteobacteria bacterium RBG_16_58_11]|nr:MAG: hypothetical protein A2Z01_08220 [Betaproteobacteria bacterium RBG_16_58_11]